MFLLNKPKSCQVVPILFCYCCSSRSFSFLSLSIPLSLFHILFSISLFHFPRLPFSFIFCPFLSIFPSRLLSLVISLSLPLSSPFSCFSFFRPTESLSWRHLSSYSPWKKNVYRGRSLFVVVFTLFWFFKNLSYQQERQNDRLLKTNARQTSQSKTFYLLFVFFWTQSNLRHWKRKSVRDIKKPAAGLRTLDLPFVSTEILQR